MKALLRAGATCLVGGWLAGCSLVTDADVGRLGSDPEIDEGCTSADACDDGIDCTADTCDRATGQCAHGPEDALCESGFCQAGIGCQDPIACQRDEDCDDGTGCNLAQCLEHQCRLEPIDADQDGVVVCGGDCRDDSADVKPGAQELCGDGLDNDCNGNTDGDDQSCIDSCGAELIIRDHGEVEGDLAPGGRDQNSEVCERATGPEVVVRLDLERNSDVMLETVGSDFDTVLYVRGDCDGPELGCSDNRSQARGWNDSRLWLQDLEAGSYYVFVDSAERGGHFRLHIERSDPRSSECGDALDITGGGTAIGHTSGDSGLDSRCSEGTGPEALFTFELDDIANVALDSTASEFDVIQELRLGDGCETESLPGWCADGTEGGESRDGLLTEGRYTVVLDGYDGASGRYVLRFFP